MRICVFLGPTISPEDSQRYLTATYLPPAAQGDVYHAVRSGAQIIGVVDGYFERVPSVWHREILWALTQGVHVYGSGSMGALRAAELHRYGMVGVGAVFEAFASGLLEDDDEVAIIHGPAETGYRPASEAMINIRATLAAARDTDVISVAVHDNLLAIAKRTFYPQRNYPDLLRAARAQGVDPVMIGRLREWLPNGRLDQKRLDAIAMLQALADFTRSVPQPKRVRFHFQETDAWAQVRRQVDGRLVNGIDSSGVQHDDAILDELRLQRELYAEVHGRALERSLALALAGTPQIDDALLEQAARALRAERGLTTPADVQGWVDSEQMTTDEVLRLVAEEAHVRRILAIHEADLERHIMDELHLRGRHAALGENAVKKFELLARHGYARPSLDSAGVTRQQLWQWLFEGLWQDTVPADLEAAARARGFQDAEALQKAALREYCYRRLLAANPVGLVSDDASGPRPDLPRGAALDAETSAVRHRPSDVVQVSRNAKSATPKRSGRTSS